MEFEQHKDATLFHEDLSSQYDALVVTYVNLSLELI